MFFVYWYQVTDAGEKNGAQGRESGIWLGGELDPRTARRW